VGIRRNNTWNRSDRKAIGSKFVLLSMLAFAALPAEQSTAFQSENQRPFEWEWDFPAEVLTSVAVKLARGNVVVKGWDRSYVHLRATQRDSSGESVAVTLRTSQANGALRIVASTSKALTHSLLECLPPDDELGDIWHNPMSVHIELFVPSRMPVNTRSMRGDIEVSGVTGALDVATNEGDLAVKNIDGEVIVVARGSVHLADSSMAAADAGARRLSVYDGEVRFWARRGDSLQVDGSRISPNAEQLEIAKTSGSESRTLTIHIRQSITPIAVELWRSRLLLLLDRT
jgi:hypothetical protein